MKISARNILKGKIVEVTKGATTAHIKIDVGGTVVTASITNAAVDDLSLHRQRGFRGHQGLRRDDRNRLRMDLLLARQPRWAASTAALAADPVNACGRCSGRPRL